MPVKPTEEELYGAMMRGTAAANVASVVKPLLDARRKILTDNVVRAYRSLKTETKLTERDAFIFVAALAAIDDLEDDLNRIIEAGSKAGKNFLG